MSDKLLKQILEEMKGLRVEMNQVRLEQQDTKVQMNSRFDTLETKLSNVEVDVAAIKASVAHIEENEPADVIGTLKHIKDKLDAQQDLTGKVDDLETDIKLIKKAITNQ